MGDKANCGIVLDPYASNRLFYIMYYGYWRGQLAVKLTNHHSTKGHFTGLVLACTFLFSSSFVISAQKLIEFIWRRHCL